MGSETARQRWTRQQQQEHERLIGIGHPAGGMSAAAVASVVGGHAGVVERLRLQVRQDTLLKRLRALGLGIERAELPSGDADMEELELMAAEAEHTAK